MRENITTKRNTYNAFNYEKSHGCSFLMLDISEHSQLYKEDIKPLNELLLDTVENYIKEKKNQCGGFELGEHTSSINILKNGSIVAKVWHDSFALSDLNRDEALDVAKEFIRIMNAETIAPYPRIYETCGNDATKWGVGNSFSYTATFITKGEAERYMRECINTRYGMKIKHSCNKEILTNREVDSEMVELYHGFGVYADRSAKTVLYHLREYIKKCGKGC